MNCGVGHRHGSDLALLWLWHRPVATAPIRPLAWELPYAMSVALKKQKQQQRKLKQVHLMLQKNVRMSISQISAISTNSNWIWRWSGATAVSALTAPGCFFSKLKQGSRSLQETGHSSYKESNLHLWRAFWCCFINTKTTVKWTPVSPPRISSAHESRAGRTKMEK